MARVGRLAGSLLVEHGGAWFLAGHLKQPLDFAQAGFQKPTDLEERAPRGVRLEVTGSPSLGNHVVVENREDLVEVLVQRLIVERTGTVSERLWRLITVEDPGDPTSPPKGEEIDARWLTTLPDAIWQIVRDSVLRCA
jgi:hypothetical protein